MDYASNQTFAPAEDLPEQAYRTARSAANAVDGAKQTARLALDAGRTYANDAVDSAGQKLRQVRGRIDQLAEQTTQYVADQPLRAVGYSVAVGFLLAVALNGLRRPR